MVLLQVSDEAWARVDASRKAVNKIVEQSEATGGKSTKQAFYLYGCVCTLQACVYCGGSGGGGTCVCVPLLVGGAVTACARACVETLASVSECVCLRVCLHMYVFKDGNGSDSVFAVKIYGVTTGFGKNAPLHIPSEHLQ